MTGRADGRVADIVECRDRIIDIEESVGRIRSIVECRDRMTGIMECR
jgi:hypothetical protein